jgi:hypothetical protein
MDRLRCGVIITPAFTSFLKEWWNSTPSQQTDRMPSLDFVHCKEGPRAGQSWASLNWILAKKIPEHECFEISGVPLHLTKQAQRGLKWRCLDARDGKLVVLGGD